MKNIIRQILKEDREQMFLDKIIKVMKNDFPLFKNMKLYGLYDQLSEEELNYIFSRIFGQLVTYTYGAIYDENGNEIYFENYMGYWEKFEFDENGNKIYEEDSDGNWSRNEYDENGNKIYYEDSYGYIVDKR